MDFIRHQLESDRTLRRLRFAYPIAISGVVLACNAAAVLLWRVLFTQSPLPYAFLLVNTLATGGLIVVGTFMERQRLLHGSSALAARLGARPLDAGAVSLTLLERRAIDMLEEMALSAHQPIPRLHVLELDPSINALTVGLNRDDGAVVLTRGAIDRLDRDELQGLFAHEVAQLASGELRVNSQLGAMKFGLELLARAGRCVLDAALPTSLPTEQPPVRRPTTAMVVPGAFLLAIGSAGHLASHLLMATTGRGTRSSSDSRAIGLTGDPEGLGGALRKICWMSMNNPTLTATALPACSIDMHHALFHTARFTGGLEQRSSQTQAVGSWLGMHPSLSTRVERLLGQVAAPKVAERSPGDDEFLCLHHPRAAAWLTLSALPPQPRMHGSGLPAKPVSDAGFAAARVERRLRNGDLTALVAATRDSSSAAGLVALLLIGRETVPEAWPAHWRAARGFQGALAARLRRLGLEDVDALRLPLLELCAKTIKPLDWTRKEELLRLLRGQIEIEPHDNPAEWMRYMLMHARLLPSAAGPRFGRARPVNTATAVRWVIALLARQAQEPELRAQRVSNEIIQSLGLCRTGQSFPPLDVAGLQVVVESLQRLPALQRPHLLGCLVDFLPQEPSPATGEFLSMLALIIDCRMPLARSPLPESAASGSKEPVSAMPGSPEQALPMAHVDR